MFSTSPFGDAKVEVEASGAASFGKAEVVAMLSARPFGEAKVVGDALR